MAPPSHLANASSGRWAEAAQPMRRCHQSLESPGQRKNTLADKQFGNLQGVMADRMEVFGAVVGTDEAASSLMEHNHCAATEIIESTQTGQTSVIHTALLFETSACV